MRPAAVHGQDRKHRPGLVPVALERRGQLPDPRVFAAPRRGSARDSRPRRDAAGLAARGGHCRDLGEIPRATRRHQRVPLDEFGRAWIGDGHDRSALARLLLERHSAANRRLTPGSLNRLAMVGNTGTSVVRRLELDRVVALPLLAHVAQRVLGAALLELVERDQLGEVEHVDLLELARRAVLARHHVHRHVDEVDDLRVALADAGRLDDDRSKPAYLSRFSTSASTALVARFCRRVASDRMNTCSAASEFMRMRSPSSAPPLRRRVGSIATTATLRSGKWRTKRISNSSVRLDLPAPPVPVMPTTGALRAAAHPPAQRLAATPSVPRRARAPRSSRDLLLVARADRSELERRPGRPRTRGRRPRSCRRGPACGRPRACRCARRRRPRVPRSRAARWCRRRRR
jgi:hypothetical protein